MHLARLRLEFETPSKTGNPVGGVFTVSALLNTSCCGITKGRFFYDALSIAYIMQQNREMCETATNWEEYGTKSNALF